MSYRIRATVAAVLFSATAASSVQAQEVITNGGFEAGLAGWTQVGAAGGNPENRYSGMANGANSPVSNQGPYTSRSGGFLAISDQFGPGAGVLYQTFTIDAAATNATLSFSMFVRNFAAATTVGDGLNFSPNAANQHARVDLLFGNLAANPFTVAPTSVIRNFYLGADVVGGAQAPWIDYSFDITNNLLQAGTYTLRFAQVDNSGFFHQGIDNVSLAVNTNTVPEPSTVALVAFGMVAAGVMQRRRRGA